MAFRHLNESLESIKYWSEGTFGSGASNVAGYLLHHAVLEIEFRRKYQSRIVRGSRGGIRREYRDRSHRNAEGAPYVADWWYGRKRRVMLCTLDATLLQSLIGRDVLHFREPTGTGPAMPPNIIQVWDVMWQDWRAVDFTMPVEVRAVIPTSILPSTKPDGTSEEGRRALARQQEIFRQILEIHFRNMSWRKKFAYMDGDVDLRIQETERQLRKRIADADEILKKQKEEEERKLEEQRVAEEKKKADDSIKGELARMRAELEKMDFATRAQDAKNLINEMNVKAGGMSPDEARKFIEELKTFGQDRGLVDL